MKCSFCNREIGVGEGVIYVRPDGKINYFCSSKCYRNAIKLGRKPQKYKWTRATKK